MAKCHYKQQIHLALLCCSQWYCLVMMHYQNCSGINVITSSTALPYGLRTVAKMQNKAKSFKVQGRLCKSLDFFACQAEVFPEVDTNG